MVGVCLSRQKAFRTASIDGGEVTLWVTSDQIAMSAQCPLLPHERPNRCVALSDAMGQSRHFDCRKTASLFGDYQRLTFVGEQAAGSSPTARVAEERGPRSSSARAWARCSDLRLRGHQGDTDDADDEHGHDVEKSWRKAPRPILEIADDKRPDCRTAANACAVD